MFIQDRHFNNYNIAVINVCLIIVIFNDNDISNSNAIVEEGFSHSKVLFMWVFCLLSLVII